MTTTTLSAKTRERVEELATQVFMPAEATDLKMVADVEPCGKLIDGSPSGLVVEKDGTRRLPRTQYGPAWMLRGGVETSEPIALLPLPEARYLFGLIASGELADRRALRRQRIEETEAAEAAAEAEAKERAKEEKRLAKKGVILREATGGGSRARERSSARRMGGTRMRVEEALAS